MASHTIALRAHQSMTWEVCWHEGFDSQAIERAIVGCCSRFTTVFQHPAMIQAWLKTKGSAMLLTPALAELRRGNEIVLVPLAVRKSLGLRRAAMVGDPHFDYQVPMATVALDWQEFWSSMWRPMAQCGRLAGLTVRRLPQRFAGTHGSTDPDSHTTVLDIGGYQDLDQYLAERGSNLRSDVRRRIRRAGEMGGTALRVFRETDVDAARAAFEAMRAAYEDLHHNEASGRLFEQPGTLAFYLELITRVLPLGLLHFSVLSIGGRDAAWHFGFMHDGILHWYKPTYARWAAHLSPGKLLLAELVRMGTAEQWKCIDFGGGREAYKEQWGHRMEALVQSGP